MPIIYFASWLSCTFSAYLQCLIKLKSERGEGVEEREGKVQGAFSKGLPLSNVSDRVLHRWRGVLDPHHQWFYYAISSPLPQHG